MGDKDSIIQLACKVRGDGQDLPQAGGHLEEVLGVSGSAIIHEWYRWHHVGFREEGVEGS